jgi:hypothetical protein
MNLKETFRLSQRASYCVHSLTSLDIAAEDAVATST